MSQIEFPISIALVGAPGSGKQAVANEFEKISASYFADHESEFVILNNAGNVLQEHLDTPMGPFGGFAEHVRACLLGYEGEQEARLSGFSYLSLGTSLQNLAHAGVTLETILTGLQTPEAQHRAQQNQISMSWLTFWFFERFRYSFGFYIPNTASNLVLPGAEEDSERQYNQRVDMALRAIFVNFGVRIQPLDQPTVEEKAQAMFDTVKDIVENGPKLSENEEEAAEQFDAEFGDRLVPPEPESTLTA